MNYQNPYQQSQQAFFPQPQGNAYLINNSLEVANVPTSGAVTLALCQSENLLYLKSMQNGNPVFMAYKLSPYEPQPSNNSIEERLKAIEDQIGKLKKGGINHELL